jgi:SAM-dependent methyltransferase
MPYYDHYTTRPRNSLGVRVKLWQARQMFALGVPKVEGRQATVLEIGPGDGYIAEIASAQDDYYAVEASVTIAESLRRRGYRVHQAFVPPLPADPVTIDACFALHVIEHMKGLEAAMEFVGAVRDRLSPKGRLIIATPDLSRWKTHFYDCDHTHVLPFTARSLRQLLGAAGMKVRYENLYVGPIFGYWGVPFAWLASLLFTPTVDDLLRRLLPGDIASRAFFTILPNLLVVAERDDA